MGTIIELPWPPSINHYWRHTKNGHYISSEGQSYRKIVYFACHRLQGLISKESRLRMSIEAYPPDKRRRDLDNILKALLDSLEHAGVYDDDSQIDFISILRKPELDNKIILAIQVI